MYNLHSSTPSTIWSDFHFILTKIPKHSKQISFNKKNLWQSKHYLPITRANKPYYPLKCLVLEFKMKTLAKIVFQFFIRSWIIINIFMWQLFENNFNDFIFWQSFYSKLAFIQELSYLNTNKKLRQEKTKQPRDKHENCYITNCLTKKHIFILLFAITFLS